LSNILAVTYEDAVAVSVAPAGNKDPKGPFCALQAATTAGTVTVITARGSLTTIYLPLGQIVPLAVKCVQSLGTAAGVVGFLAMPYGGAGQ
jgi:hypothetical protein